MASQVLVQVESRGDGANVARVVINNERKLNTLNRALMEEFVEAVESLTGDEALRAVVVTAAGEKAFIGGADIDEMAALNPSTAEAFITLLHRCCEVLRELPVPVIARIQGYALGGGLELAAACDLRIAADTAILGMPEVKLGIPSVIEAALLPTLVGWGRAREIVMLGENFSAADAERWGLVERVVPKDKLDESVEAWIGALLTCGPRAVRLQKKLVRAWEDLPLSEAIRAGVRSFVEAWRTEEPAGLMREFQQKRRGRS